MSAIVPFDKITSQVIIRFEVFCSELILNTSAMFRVLSYGVDDKYIDTVYVNLVGEEYSAWGTSDEYVIQFCATKLGYTII
jgi:hypothetical protein